MFLQRMSLKCNRICGHTKHISTSPRYCMPSASVHIPVFAGTAVQDAFCGVVRGIIGANARVSWNSRVDAATIELNAYFQSIPMSQAQQGELFAGLRVLRAAHGDLDIGRADEGSRD